MRRYPKKTPTQNDSSKFKNQKVTIDGHKFDSKAEARRYEELKTLAQTQKIVDLRLQVRFDLIPAQRIDGKCVERACQYIADFTYLENGKLVVEDVKSPATITPVFVLKRKLMLYIRGIRVKEFMPCKMSKKGLGAG